VTGETPKPFETEWILSHHHDLYRYIYSE